MPRSIEIVHLGCHSAESVFASVYANSRPCVWLDSSSVVTGLSQFSFMADASGPSAEVIRYRSKDKRLEIIRPDRREILRQSIFDFLREALFKTKPSAADLPFEFCGGFVGYLGYELKAECGGNSHHESDLPDAYFLRVSRFLAFDHREGTCYVVAIDGTDDDSHWVRDTASVIRLISETPIPAHAPRHVEFKLEQDEPEYIRNINVALGKIRDGHSYQVCLTNRIRCAFDGDAPALYRILRRRNPAPFAAFMQCDDFAVLSSSPERFLRIDHKGSIEARPMKGTMARSGNPVEDHRLASLLQNSEKNRAENLMIVDLIRNDFGRVSQIGSVEVPSLMTIESYATVHQMVSSVKAQLSPLHDRIDCIQAAFPGGSMTGAPKLRTMEIIDALESSARGVYSGALGYLSFSGAVDFSIPIRTMVISHGSLSIGVGGGIIALSDPHEEFNEALLKAEALMAAVCEYYGEEFSGGRFLMNRSR